MTVSFSFSSVLLISYLFLLAAAAASSSSSFEYSNDNNKKKLVMFPLTHSLSTNSEFNTSTHLLLKSTSSRSAARFNNKKQQRRHPAVSAVALSPGSDYTMPLSLGSQGSVVSVYMDTGSDTVWVPCTTFTCIMCEGKSDDPLSPHNLSATASPVSCQSRACSAGHSGIPTSDLCAMARCPLESIEMSECNNFSCPAFYYAYGDGSFVASLYKDTLQMSSLIIKNFTFGCAHEALGEPVGVAGFGRGPLSLPAQLSPHHLGTQFSYCLISHSFDSHRVRQPSPLILGRRFDNSGTNHNNNNSNKQQQGGFDNSTTNSNAPTPPTDDDDDDLAYTPMLENKKHPYYYYVGLEAITVGNKRIPAPENMKRIDRKGNGGMVVDSGTTYTMLPQQLYNSVVSQFRTSSSAVKFKRAASVEDRTGLTPCYYLPPNKVVIPQLVLHFGGNTSVVMPRRNYFYQFTDDDKKKKSVAVGCMMLMNAGLFSDDSDSGGPGPAGLLGNYQQQGLEVVYDLLNKRIGFANRKCASLWETLPA